MDEPILKSKIIPPYVRKHFINRNKILRKLQHYNQYNLTFVHAGPGFGKSIAISMFIEQIQEDFAWYTISEDVDSIQFIKYIIFAIRELDSDFCTDCIFKFENNNEYQASEDENLSIWFLFLNELSLLNKSLILVLDDIHLIFSNQEMKRYLDLLIRHLPRNVHVILISRTFPPLKEISTMMVKHQILEINQEDLSFSKEEIEEVFKKSYKYPISKVEINKIHENTEGWVIAVQMIWQGLVRNLSFDDIWKNKTDTMDGLFQLLATEIVGRLPNSVQKFIKKTSVLSILQEDVCQYIMPDENIKDLLDYLHKQNLFIQYMGDNQYRYHALFQEFAQSTLSKDEKEELHSLLYKFYHKKRNFEETLRHIRYIDNGIEQAAFLNNYGLELLKHGKVDLIFDLIKDINISLKEKYPMLWVVQADINRLRCKYDDSIKQYQLGKKQSLQLNNNKALIRALSGEARVYLDTVQPSKAETYLKEALRLCHKQRSDCDDMAFLYALYAENQLNLGNTKIAEKLFQLSLTKQHDVSRGNIEVRLHLRTGRIRNALQLLEKKLEQEMNNSLKPNVRSHRETSVLLSIISSFAGDGQKAKSTAEKGITIGKEMNSPFVEAVGWMRLGHALQLLIPNDTNKAIESYEKSIRIIDELGVEKGKVEPLMGLCLLYGFKGELDLAVQYGNEGVNIADKVKDRWFSNIIHLSIAIAYAHNEQYELAKKKFMEAYQGLSRLGDQFTTTVIWMWLAYIAHKEEEWDTFVNYTGQFLDQMHKGKYQFLITQPSFFGPRDLHRFAPYLIEVKKRNLDNQGTVTNWLIEKGWISLDFHPGYTLRIQMLGDFRVWLGEYELKDKDWQRENAKLLFQLLVTRRHELLTKIFIQSKLWPEHTEEQSNRDLKVALNAVNKALEPNRPNKTSPFFIQRHGNSYGFNMVSGYELDVEVFEANVLSGLKVEDHELAISYLEKGLSLYVGDFLPEQIHEDWTMEERERLQVLFLRGAERISKIELERKNYTSAISWGQRIIAMDNTWEEAYHIMMLASIEEGNRSYAMKLFHKCKSILQKEIGVAPTPELVRLYESLL